MRSIKTNQSFPKVWEQLCLSGNQMQDSKYVHPTAQNFGLKGEIWQF